MIRKLLQRSYKIPVYQREIHSFYEISVKNNSCHGPLQVHNKYIGMPDNMRHYQWNNTEPSPPTPIDDIARETAILRRCVGNIGNISGYLYRELKVLSFPHRLIEMV